MGRFVVKDTFYKKAKQEGFRARSAYKLREIQQKYHVIKQGDEVLDLGCAPGSWLQVLSGIIGGKGFVQGIDLLPILPLPQKNVAAMVADIRALNVEELLAELSIPAFDVVTCDIAPNLTGIRDVDTANIAELFTAVRTVVRSSLKKGGNFIFKSFFTEELKPTIKDLEKLCARVSIYKPPASRGVSSEVYLVCVGKRQ
ncbi:MAG TPA: RlmE family RNA methyltransferase [Syntrophorhabdales bacterium]|nr:RlmE family RNA methyltransferase [Syntrophorhabdales bacterium]